MTQRQHSRAPGPVIAVRSRAAIMRHRIESPRWTAPAMKVAFLSDFHVSAPWSTLGDLRRAGARAMEEEPHLIVLGGDFLAPAAFPGRNARPARIVEALADLDAPQGVWAILGSHDWKDCPQARRSDYEHNSVVEAFANSPAGLLRNRSVALGRTGAWLVGFDSQMPEGRASRRAFHDPVRAYANVPKGAPVILAAHEPDWFAEGDPRAVLQLSGHTHAGQANLFGWRPLTPSRHGARFAWGHHRDGDRHLVVSGGLGFSGFPLRLAAPPEITLVEIRQGPG